MYISKKNREIIRQKFNGLCAYSGTPLEDDWQVEHIKPVRRNWWDNTVMYEENNNFDNLVPVQKLINHYKHSLCLEEYRKRLLKLHLRLAKLPKNPRTERGKKRKEYILKIANYFGITEKQPFTGIFYFERIIKKIKNEKKIKN